jgi:hypothetical protein
MGFLNKAKRALGVHDKKLRERGVQGTAKVVSSKKTMLSDSDEGDGSHFYKYGLVVTVPGSEPYDAEYMEVDGWLDEGGEYPVFVDPKDRSNVFIDIEPMRQARIDQASAKLSSFSETVAEASQVQAFGMSPPAPGAPAPPVAIEPIAGITLERYAELSAAKVKQGIATQEQQDAWLQAEGIAPTAFLDAANGWNQRMSDPAVISAYSAAYQRALSS